MTEALCLRVFVSASDIIYFKYKRTRALFRSCLQFVTDDLQFADYPNTIGICRVIAWRRRWRQAMWRWWPFCPGNGSVRGFMVPDKERCEALV